MTWTNKVSNIIKGTIQANLANIGFGGLSQAFAKGQSVKKQAAKLAAKSPLDLSQSPVAHMEPTNNPFTYSSLYYPEETSNLGEGHYIIFDIIENYRTGYGGDYKTGGGKVNPFTVGTVGERQRQNKARVSKLVSQGFLDPKATSVVRKQSSGMASGTKIGATHTSISDSIVLYAPPQNKFDYKVTYENIDTGMAGMLAGLLDSKSLMDAAGGLKDAGVQFIETISRAAIEIALPGFGATIDKAKGRAMNPRAEMVFKSVPFRTFSFPFQFAPKSVKEKDTMYKIINLFKFHMMPELKSDGYMTSPSEFQITYMYRDKANMYIPKISRCILSDLSLDFAPEGVFTTFMADNQGAPPVLTKMDLTFNELEIMTKETIAAGH